MSLFGRLFGKKADPPAHAPGASGPTDRSAPVQGPPEFVRAVEIQRAYWTHDAREQAELEDRGVDRLGWRELLRLHHLACLDRLNAGPDRATTAETCWQTARRLLAADSPYRPRVAMVWQGETVGGGGEPDLRGEFLNASLTHLGCLEVYRLDAANRPSGLDFVGFDDLCGVAFAPPKLVRAARLFYEGGASEVVFVPLLYGLTWAVGNEYDRDGRMTRFVSHLHDAALDLGGATGLGVGQQDFTVRGPDGGASLFGLGSVSEVSFPLDVRNPRFDERARDRGIDPDEVRRSTGGGNA
ncbi:hypothetical protein J0H58_27930 [bacterium]|nr:hypothetical protein [bacterium]